MKIVNSERFRQKNVYSFFNKSKILILTFQALLIVFASYSQQIGQINISGDITDPQGEPIIGVNILVINKAKGTITDFNGHYTLQVNPDDTLKVSFIGYEEQIVPVSGKSIINIQMEEKASDLDEFVVVGYGEVKRENLLGAVSSMTTAEIEDIPATSLTNLLEGRMPGVSISPAQPTGNPGAQTRIRIRAETTFGLSGLGIKDPAPLYIVDGFEMTQEEFDVLDPSEIESFSVLKDASAAVYGSKGANGVVLVKTKRGRKGKLKLSYSGSHGIMDATQLTEMLSPVEQAMFANAKYMDDPDWVPYTNSQIDSLRHIDTYDWLREAWSASNVSRHTVNISGGNEKITYYAGGTYLYTEGNFPGLGVGKYTYRLGLDANITDRLKANITLASDSRDFKRPFYQSSGFNTMEGLFMDLLQMDQRYKPYQDGKPVFISNDFDNPMAFLNSDSYRRSVNKGTTLNLRLAYEFERVKGLVASATYSRRENHSYSKDYSIPYTLYEFEPGTNNVIAEHVEENRNRISEDYGYGQNYQLNLNLNYNRKFGLHDISSFVTYEQSESSGFGFKGYANNIQIYGLEIQDAFDNEGAATTDGSMDESGDLAAVFRLNYSYASKYLFESTLRYDVSTRFAPGERGGLFPSLSAGWVISEEDFMKNGKISNVVDFLKVRYSFGVLGYASLGAWEYLLTYTPSSGYLFGGSSPTTGMALTNNRDIVSTGVSWEKSQMQNLGIDLKLFNSKLSITTDLFYTYQYDILDKISVELPETGGIDGKNMPSQNLGRLEAWGYDMTIGYRGKINKDLTWYVNGIFSFNSNRILERPTDKQPNDFRYPIGQSTFAEGREEGYISDGIIRSQEQLDAINAEWQQTWGWDYTTYYSLTNDYGVGMLFVQDIGRPGIDSLGEPEIVFEPDGKINGSDRTYVQRVNDHFVWKNLLPTYITLGGRWKDLSFSMNWGMAYGITNTVTDKAARASISVNDMTNKTVYTSNVPSFWADFWSEDNPNAEYPSPKYAALNQLVTTFWMKDVYQLRLKTLTINYRVPSEFAEKYKIPQFSVYFSGKNLWTPISTFHYKDDAIARYNTYPYTREFNFGLKFDI
ncbi:SusC/RagA family TonB-linked outer membrane protein [Saccharicrinis sp. FJH62]|uniref:SusC/RagA family TonB-linked outer membrane protein n=1 Tax=Saccharicrinis sp. FJH62 TaxID=3344657 RepID=UPI0035D4E732